MRGSRPVVVSLIYWALVVVLCAAMTEASVRSWGFLPVYMLQTKGIPYSLRFKLDEELLYRFLPDASHSINELGFRDGQFAAKAPGTKRVVVIGDSFAAGLFVPLEETFPKQLQALTPTSEVLNLGVQGYGPDQELLTLRRLGSKLAPDTIIWSLFPSNDFNDLIKNRLLEESPDGGVMAAKPNAVTAELPAFRSLMLARFFATGHFLPQAAESRLQPLLFVDSEAPEPVREDTVVLFQAIATAFKEEASNLKAKLLAVVIPSLEEAQSNDKESMFLNQAMISRLNECGVPFVDLSESFLGHPELYTSEEHHFSAAGHRAAAAAIAARMEQ